MWAAYFIETCMQSILEINDASIVGTEMQLKFQFRQYHQYNCKEHLAKKTLILLYVWIRFK